MGDRVMDCGWQVTVVEDTWSIDAWVLERERDVHDKWCT